MTKQEILEKILKRSGLSQESFANSLGYKKAAFNNYLKGRRDIPQDLIQSLSDIYHVNPAIFFDSDASLYLDDVISDDKMTEIYNQLNEPNQAKVYNFAEKTLEEQNTNVIDLREYRDVDIQSNVSAGTGIVDLDADHTERISYNGFIPNKYDAAFRVQGDSMEPMFQDGEIVFVVKDEDVRNGQIGVVLIDGEAFIKKMYVEGDKLRLVSLNRLYEDIIANGSNEISVYGRVIL